jgi:Exodeoxyribonuclease X-like C-terminal
MSDIIPFGKYRGQEIEQIRQRDPAYLQWLMQQAWFSEKFAPIYQVVINNFAPPSEETPAHNALQVRFLDFDFQCAFWEVCGANKLIKWEQMEQRFLHRTQYLRETAKPCTHKIAKGRTFTTAHFEDICDVRFTATAWVGFPRDLRELAAHKIEECFQVFIEIKPTMGDDYPAVLRQIKRQQKQHEHDWRYQDCWFLLLDQFCSQAVLLDRVREIFSADEIGIVLMQEVRDFLIKARE